MLAAANADVTVAAVARATGTLIGSLKVKGNRGSMISIFSRKKYKLFERGTKQEIKNAAGIMKKSGYSIRRRKGKMGWELWVRKKTRK